MTQAVNHAKTFEKLKARLWVLYDLPVIGKKESEELIRLEHVLQVYIRLYSFKDPAQDTEFIPCDGCQALIPLIRPGQWAFCSACTDTIKTSEPLRFKNEM